MAWTSMHFAVGMCGGAALMAVPCLFRRRGWRYLPVAMTIGGLWAIIPDCPRLWREDFTSLPFAATLGAKDFELWLHSIGNLFFMHRSLDAQPKEFALLGLAMIIGLYNLSLIGMLWHTRRSRRQRVTQSCRRVSKPGEKAAEHDSPTLNPVSTLSSEPVSSSKPDGRPVIGRIGTG